MSFQTDIINIFLKTTSDVLKQEVQAKFKRGEMTITKGSFLSDEVTIVIAVIGDIVGQVYFALSRETARKFISTMINEEVSKEDPSIQDGIAEMGNVITGNASIQLAVQGYNCDISPPTLIRGSGLEISNFGISTVKVPIITQHGQIVLRIGVKEKPKD